MKVAEIWLARMVMEEEGSVEIPLRVKSSSTVAVPVRSRLTTEGASVTKERETVKVTAPDPSGTDPEEMSKSMRAVGIASVTVRVADPEEEETA